MFLYFFSHPNIIGYKEAFFEDSTSTLCLVMEFANDEDLYQKILKHQKNGSMIDENQIWRILIQIVRALKVLHSQNIFHRDLKSANVFLNKDGNAKLGDLNVSKIAQKNGLLFTQTGTPYYASPEVWKEQPYDSKSDIWSLGCVLYEMATLKPPFRASDMNGLYKRVLKGMYPKIPGHYSADLSLMIKSLLQVQPNLRPTSDQILKMDIVKKRNYLLTKQSASLMDTHEDLDNVSLLNTIKVPKNLAQLTKNLPRSNYVSTRESKFSNSSHGGRLPSEPILPSGNRLLPQISSMKDIRQSQANESLSCISRQDINVDAYPPRLPKKSLAVSIEEGLREAQNLRARKHLEVIQEDCRQLRNPRANESPKDFLADLRLPQLSQGNILGIGLSGQKVIEKQRAQQQELERRQARRNLE